MAVQNFLSGGYYGKLGNTVGQRWKNKRTVRAYVIPANPRTEKQQKNRGNFGECTAKAQLALQMNYNTTLFNSTTASAWNMRMSTARQLQKDGKQGLDLIPLCPISFTPTYIITDISNIQRTNDTYYTANVEGTLPSVQRSLSILVQKQNEQTSETLGEFLFRGDFVPGEPNTIKIYNNGISLTDAKIKIRVVSNDETVTSDMILSQELAIGASGKQTVYLDFSNNNVSRTDNEITITSQTPSEVTVNNIIGEQVTVVKGGQLVTKAPESMSIIDNGGFFAIRIVVDNDSDINKAFFGLYCDISFTDFSLESEKKIYKVRDNRVEISENNPAYTITSYTVDEPDDDTVQAVFHFNEGLPIFGAFSGSLLCGAYVAAYVDNVDCTFAAMSRVGNTSFTVASKTKVFPAKNTTCQIQFAGKTIDMLGVKYTFAAFTANYNNKKTFVDLTDKQIFVNDGRSKAFVYVVKDGGGNITNIVNSELEIITTKLSNNTNMPLSINGSQNIKLTLLIGAMTYSSSQMFNENASITAADPDMGSPDVMSLFFDYDYQLGYTDEELLYTFSLSKADPNADSYIAGNDIPFPIKINPDFTFSK